MYLRQEVEVRPGVFERIDHVVQHIQASARISVYPPAPQEYKRQCPSEDMLEIMCAPEPALVPPVRHTVLDQPAQLQVVPNYSCPHHPGSAHGPNPACE